MEKKGHGPGPLSLEVMGKKGKKESLGENVMAPAKTGSKVLSKNLPLETERN